MPTLIFDIETVGERNSLCRQNPSLKETCLLVEIVEGAYLQV
jgi:hypothetical protein